jgi:hypothetical protein
MRKWADLQKSRKNSGKIFAKTKNVDFREKFSRKSRIILAKTKNTIFAKNFCENKCYFSQKLLLKQKFLAKNLKFS